VTDPAVNTISGTGEPTLPLSAGALLRAARETAGLTVDAVAQQLKLAPRQVRAIEDGDFARLPGRTFVRGFVRNYARLVRLDPEAVLGALPAAAPTLGSPALQPTAPSIGELPTAEHGKSGWTRWAIPLTLVAIIAAAALYEFMRPTADVRRSAAKDPPAAAESALPPSLPPEHIGTPLPNPVATETVPANSPASREPPAAPPVATSPAVPSQFVQTAPDTRPTATLSVPPTDAPLTLAFRDFSWTEVKDRNGTVLLSRMNPGGTTQALAGAPPLEIVIGNAIDVTLTWKGKHIDLLPHTRQNVARLTLQ
jgi:cytoskeleton protein RodZ